MTIDIMGPLVNTGKRLNNATFDHFEISSCRKVNDICCMVDWCNSQEFTVELRQLDGVFGMASRHF